VRTVESRTSPAVPFLDLGGATRAVRDEVVTGWSAILDGNAFIGGGAVVSFEESWAAYCGSATAVGVGNGTDSLHLAFRALGIGPGDEVVVPANTFVATAEAVVLAGATPHFADVDPRSLLVTPESLERAVSPRTKALAVVHLYGQVPDMDAVTGFASANDLHVVEDAAQAHGADWHGRRAGSWGTVGSFSFYPGKNLGAFGDAGAITTDDEGVARTLRSLRDHGRVPGSHYEHALVGTNSRLDALQAVVLSAKLRRLDGWNARRRELWAAYAATLDPELVSLVRAPEGGTAVHHLAVVRVADRDAVRARLAERGIGTGIHYPVPCHLLAPYAQFATGPLPVAERAAAEIMSLPMFPEMTLDDVEHVATELNQLLRPTRAA
jgi:dTDP-4-amino-4,6-dideoxygalactose transaminase